MKKIILLTLLLIGCSKKESYTMFDIYQFKEHCVSVATNLNAVSYDIREYGGNLQCLIKKHTNEMSYVFEKLEVEAILRYEYIKNNP